MTKIFNAFVALITITLISEHKDGRMFFRYTHLKIEDILRKL